MPESKEEREKRELSELEGKNIAHYATLLSAWIHTKMERDKTLITLSAAAIGLLVTILTAVGIRGIWQIVSTIGAFIGFGATIRFGLTIYELNADHIEGTLKGARNKNLDLKLEKFDIRSKRFFYLGVVCIILLGISAISTTKGGDMSDNKQESFTKRIMESLRGLSKLSPEKLKKGKSLNGTSNEETSEKGNSESKE